MAGLWQKCCDTGCDLEIGDLPTITITGMTGGGWDYYGECCFKQDFEYDTPYTEWTEGAPTANYFDCIYEYESQYDVMGQKYVPRPYYTESDTVPDPITDEAFCCTEYEVMGIVAYHTRTRSQQRYISEYKLLNLTVYISKETLDCLSDPAVEKWVVTLKHNFRFRGKLQHLYFCDQYRDITILDEACFETTNDLHTQYCDEGSEDWADYVEGSSGPGGNVVYLAEGDTFTLRHKWYDALPGTITFGDSDTPIDTCPFTCHDLNEIINEICTIPEPSATSILNGWPYECDEFITTDLIDFIDISVDCPDSVGVEIFPDTPPGPGDDCVTTGIIVDMDVTCPALLYRSAPILDDLLITQKEACCYEDTNPCNVTTLNCTTQSFLHQTGYLESRTDNSSAVEYCVGSSVTLIVS